MEQFNANTKPRYVIAKKILCLLVGLGAIASLSFWYPKTVHVIQEFGFREAFTQTFIHRIIIDLGALLVCILFFKELGPLEEKY